MRLLVTRDDYFRAALEVLATRGHSALRIGSLCRRLGVTAGSFYHYFGSWDGFVVALLDHWEREKTQRLVAQASAEPDARARVRALRDFALSLPHEAETGIRGWAHVDPVVAAVQRRVDAERLEAVTDAIAGIVTEPSEAHRLAVIAVSIMVGVQQWRAPVDPTELGALLVDFEAFVLARAVALT